MGPEIPFPVLVSLLLFLLMVIKIVKRAKPRKLPPGPRKRPIIGNLLQVAAGGSLVHHTLRDLALQHGPVMYLQLGQVPTIVVSSPTKDVYKTNDLNFSTRPYSLITDILSYHSTGLIFAPHGSYWRQLRKICVTELLSAKRVQSFRAIREEECSSLVRTISSSIGVPVNLSELIFSLTYSITSRVALGSQLKEQERFISIIGEATKLTPGLTLSDMYPSLKLLEVMSGMKHRVEKLHREMDELLEKIIYEQRERRVQGSRNGDGEDDQRDLVDVLLDLQEHGNLEHPLTDNAIKAVIFDMFSAGSDTSSTVVEWAMSEILKTPRLMKEAQAEVRRVFNEKGDVDETDLHKLKFLIAIIKETLRLHPSVTLLARETKKDCVVSGYDIPAKAKVVTNIWAIGRDPKYWSEPERFYPERFLDSSVDYKGMHYEFIPFGVGRRMCPGISYSEPNIQLPLAKLLYHFDWELPNGRHVQDLDMTEAFGMTVRRKGGLFVIPIPYGRSSPQ